MVLGSFVVQGVKSFVAEWWLTDGKQLKSRVRTNSLDVYRGGFHGISPSIWKKIPQEITSVGYNKGWLKIKKRCTDWFLGKPSSKCKEKKREPSVEILEDTCSEECIQDPSKCRVNVRL